MLPVPGTSRRLGKSQPERVHWMKAWSRERVLQFLRVALPVSAAVVAAPLALTSWIAVPSTRPLDREPLALTAPVPPSPVAPGTSANIEPDRVRTLRSGDTLGKALRDLGFASAEAERAAAAAGRYVNPRQLQPGMRVAAYLEGAAPGRFELAVAGQGELSVERGGEDWLPSWRPYRRELRTRAVHGRLAGSLEGSVAAAGADPELTYAMADVLQWDLDFNRDLQPGDRFDVLFEEIYLEGRYFGVERVLALSYTQANRKLEVYRYGSAGAYYDAEGRPSEKMFLRAPLPYSRVTSKFSAHRFHPVLKVSRPHYGVDYGAPVGTPVRVTAAGTVLSAGWDGGGGKAVKVRHPNGYLTGYLHLSRFAAGIRPGARVRQGELIGYVGQTGLATGPHLDYRVQRDGTWFDPQSLKSVPAPPLDSGQLAAFVELRDLLRPVLAGTAAPSADRAAAFTMAAAGSAPEFHPGGREAAALSTTTTTRK